MITPIQKYKDILLKREDKFILGEVNGGKLRQAIYLIEKNLETIRNKWNGIIVCASSIKSPQSAIISEVAKKYNLKCLITSYKTKKLNINLSIAQHNGAELFGYKCGYSNVLEHKARALFGFYMNMGFSSEDAINANIEQVKNIPDDLDYLVIPVGSAMNFISIMKGLEIYNKIPRVGVCGVSVGRSPTKAINTYLKTNIPFKIYKSPYPYSKEINIDNFYFDPIYESKAYDWIQKNLDTKSSKVLMWVVGKRNLTFKPQKIKWINF